MCDVIEEGQYYIHINQRLSTVSGSDNHYSISVVYSLHPVIGWAGHYAFGDPTLFNFIEMHAENTTWVGLELWHAHGSWQVGYAPRRIWAGIMLKLATPSITRDVVTWALLASTYYSYRIEMGDAGVPKGSGYRLGVDVGVWYRRDVTVGQGINESA